MKKFWVLMLLLNASLYANAWAKDDSGLKDIGSGLKKAGDSAGSLLGQAGKAVAPGVGKIESSLSGVKQGGKKTDKADK